MYIYIYICIYKNTDIILIYRLRAVGCNKNFVQYLNIRQILFLAINRFYDNKIFKISQERDYHYSWGTNDFSE